MKKYHLMAIDRNYLPSMKYLGFYYIKIGNYDLASYYLSLIVTHSCDFFKFDGACNSCECVNNSEVSERIAKRMCKIITTKFFSASDFEYLITYIFLWAKPGKKVLNRYLMEIERETEKETKEKNKVGSDIEKETNEETDEKSDFFDDFLIFISKFMYETESDPIKKKINEERKKILDNFNEKIIQRFFYYPEKKINIKDLLKIKYYEYLNKK
jgi:hypothetical protein